jgi:hypothetical protein
MCQAETTFPKRYCTTPAMNVKLCLIGWFERASANDYQGNIKLTRYRVYQECQWRLLLTTTPLASINPINICLFPNIWLRYQQSAKYHYSSCWCPLKHESEGLLILHSNLSYILRTRICGAPRMYYSTKDEVNCGECTPFPDPIWQNPSYHSPKSSWTYPKDFQAWQSHECHACCHFKNTHHTKILFVLKITNIEFWKLSPHVAYMGKVSFDAVINFLCLILINILI